MSLKTLLADKTVASREQWPGLDRTSPYAIEGAKMPVEPTFNPIDAFERLMNVELSKGDVKYGKKDTTEFLRGIDPNFELGAIVKYASRIARGDSRAETDIVKIATYAYFYWKHHYSS